MMTSVHSAFDRRIYHKQAKSLLVAGYEVPLIAQHSRDETIDGIRIKALPKPGTRLTRLPKMSSVVWLACREMGDVHHFHEPELWKNGCAVRCRSSYSLSWRRE